MTSRELAGVAKDGPTSSATDVEFFAAMPAVMCMKSEHSDEAGP